MGAIRSGMFVFCTSILSKMLVIPQCHVSVAIFQLKWVNLVLKQVDKRQPCDSVKDRLPACLNDLNVILHTNLSEIRVNNF